MPTLFNRRPMDSYQELLKLTNTGAGLDTTLRTVEDGVGAVSPLSLSTTQVALNGLIWPASAPTTSQYLTLGSGNQLAWNTVTVPTKVSQLTNDSGFITSNALSTYAPSASPALTGTPTGPTATAGTNTTQLATTAFVTNAVSSVSGGGGSSTTPTTVYQGQLSTTNTSLVTLAATTLLDEIALCNTSGSVQTVTLYLVPNGSSASASNAIFYTLSIPANQTLIFSTVMSLAGGSSIYGAAGTAGTVNVIISGLTGSKISNLYFGTIATSVTSVYTPSTAKTISSMVVCNTTNITQTYSIYFGGTATSNAYFYNVTINAYSTSCFDLATVLPTGTTIYAVGSASGLSFMVNGF